MRPLQVKCTSSDVTAPDFCITPPGFCTLCMDWTESYCRDSVTAYLYSLFLFLDWAMDLFLLLRQNVRIKVCLQTKQGMLSCGSSYGIFFVLVGFFFAAFVLFLFFDLFVLRAISAKVSFHDRLMFFSAQNDCMVLRFRIFYALSHLDIPKWLSIKVWWVISILSMHGAFEEDYSQHPMINRRVGGDPVGTKHWQEKH